MIESNVNTYVVAYSRLRCRKNRRENRRQIKRKTTVAYVTEALATNRAPSQDSDQTVWMCRLIQVFAGRIYHFS